MDVLTLTLLAWIAANTSLSSPDVPRIELVPEQELIAIQYGPNPPGTSFKLEGLYNFNTATIYLLDTWSPEDLFDRSVLLHELVHHLQWTNQLVVPCRGALERQAYGLQVAWLREQGIEDPYAFLETDEFTIRVLTACPGQG